MERRNVRTEETVTNSMVERIEETINENRTKRAAELFARSISGDLRVVTTEMLLEKAKSVRDVESKAHQGVFSVVAINPPRAFAYGCNGFMGI